MTLADKIDAKGGNGGWARSQIATKAHLTNQEQQTLNAVAADYRTKNDTILASIIALAAKGVSASNAQQVRDLQNQRKQNALDHIAQLQTAFGNVHFHQFLGYARGTSGLKAFAEPTAAQTQQPGKEPL
jgi:hypothetical protein